MFSRLGGVVLVQSCQGLRLRVQSCQGLRPPSPLGGKAVNHSYGEKPVVSKTCRFKFSAYLISCLGLFARNLAYFLKRLVFETTGFSPYKMSYSPSRSLRKVLAQFSAFSYTVDFTILCCCYPFTIISISCCLDAPIVNVVRQVMTLTPNPFCSTPYSIILR